MTLPNGSFLTGDRSETRQDPEVIVRTLEEITRSLLEQYPNPAGIGITGQMHGVLYTDKEGRAVSPLYTWQDRRGLKLSADGGTVADRIARQTGYPVSTGYGLVTHAALSENGEVPEEATALCTIADYAAMRLTGRSAPVIEASNAAGLGLFDVRLGRFDEAALRAVGIPQELLPQVEPSIAKVGEYGPGIPVFNAIGDNQASVLGSLKDLRSTLLLNVGTGGQLSVYSERFAAVPGLETRPFPGGGYLLVGATLAGGKTYAMLERFFRSVLEAFTDQAGPQPELYERMEAPLDQACPPGDKLTVRTQFYGTRENPDRRGAIEGIGPANFTPEHLLAGFLEGMADELFGFFAGMPESLRSGIRSLVGSGNGIRRNRHLRRICSDRFGMPLFMPAFQEEASVGAALHAAVGAGLVNGYAAAGGLLSYEPSV
ncbi:hypothetical protein LJK88_23745 [Paenibacillus sp. P26]|nr:hypothetical protein LJK88_23745 [Paenibacillus sp. P26]